MIMNGMPDGNYYVQPQYNAAPPAEPQKKKSRRGLIIGICVAVAALVIAAVIFFLIYLSAGAKFNRAMEKQDYEAAEKILEENQLKASEENDGHYLTLANHYLNNFNKGKDDYENAVKNIVGLRSVEFFDNATAEKIEDLEENMIDSHIGEIYNAFCDGVFDYDAAVKRIKEANPFDEDMA